MQPPGGAPHCENPMVKWYPEPFYHRIFRSPIKFLPDMRAKKSIDKYIVVPNSGSREWFPAVVPGTRP